MTSVLVQSSLSSSAHQRPSSHGRLNSLCAPRPYHTCAHIRLGSRRQQGWQESRRCRQVTTMGLFGLGIPELAIVAGVSVLLFGPSKLPGLGKELGKTVKSFQSAAKEFETELKNAAEETTKTLPDDEAKR